KVLDDLRLAGLPLERSEEPPNVYWSVPKNWFPGAVAFAGEQVQALLRLLRHAPESPNRAMLLTKVVQGAAGVRGSVDGDIVTSALSEEEEQYLWEIEDSLERRQSVRLRYYSSHKGSISWRFASVQRVVVDGPVRFVIRCHNDNKLKWFRLDNVLWARVTDTEAYRAAIRADVDRYIEESASGFHSGQAPVTCVFTVRLPEARWA